MAFRNIDGNATNDLSVQGKNSNHVALFAGGCFWGLELVFQRMEGVRNTSVGYAQGQTDNPTYKDVKTGRTGHAEVVKVEYDPTIVPLKNLVKTFFQHHDSTTLNRQKNDVGTQYRSGMYYATQSQRSVMEAAKAAVQMSLGQVVTTEVKQMAQFFPAEDHHQQFLEKGGKRGMPQCAAKGCSDKIRCYG